MEDMNNVEIIISGEKDIVSLINDEIKTSTKSDTFLTKRNNLDGDTATWIIISTLVIQSLPHVLTFIKENLIDGKVRKIKVGDIEIENPSKKMIAELEETLIRRIANNPENE